MACSSNHQPGSALQYFDCTHYLACISQPAIKADSSIMDTGSDKLVSQRRTDIWDVLRLALAWQVQVLEATGVGSTQANLKPLLMTDERSPPATSRRLAAQQALAVEVCACYAIV